VLKVARVKGASFYHLQCHKFLGASEILYSCNETPQGIAVNRRSEEGGIPDDGYAIIYDERMMVRGKLAQALSDPHEDVVLLIDELDKIPADEALEALLLEFPEEHAITVAETNMRLRSASGKPPRTITTWNAGVAGGGSRARSRPVSSLGSDAARECLQPARDFVQRRKALRALTDADDSKHGGSLRRQQPLRPTAGDYRRLPLPRLPDAEIRRQARPRPCRVQRRRRRSRTIRAQGPTTPAQLASVCRLRW